MRDAALVWLRDATSFIRGRVAFLALCAITQGGLGIGYALLLREVVDAAVSGDVSGFWYAVVATTVLVLAQLMIRAVVRVLEEHATASLENTLKMRLFDVILRGDAGRVTAVHSGAWMMRLTGDVKTVADGVVGILPGVMGMVAQLVGSLVAVVWLDSRLAVVLIWGGVALVVLTLLFRRTLRRLHRSIQEADGHLRSYLQDRLGGLLTIRSFAAERVTLDGASALAEEHLRARMRRMHFANVCNVGFGLAMSGARLGAIAWCGYQILVGAMDFGTLLAMAQLVAQIQMPLANISGFLPRWYAMLGSAERLMEAESLAGTDGEAVAVDQVRDLFAHELVAVGLEGVTYSYWPSTEHVSDMDKRDAPVVVRNLSLRVDRRTSVALAGRSGCGKSTTLRLLMGAYVPDAGERYVVRSDGTHQKLDGSLRRLFAYVPQGNQLMGSSVREVVSLGLPEAAADDARLWEALSVACADGFVAELEGGLDAPLGERGAGLSEGQGQRLAVARAVFSGSPILLLDEATSALDAETEERLLRNLQSLKDRTVVVAAHRPAALAACDHVIRLSSPT